MLAIAVASYFVGPICRGFFACTEQIHHNETIWVFAHERPNRDVRFAADKTPYRTNAGMWAGDVGGVYLSVSKEGLETS